MKSWPCAIIVASFLAAALVFSPQPLHAGEPSITWAGAAPGPSLQVTAERAVHWREGSYDVWHLRRPVVRQGSTTTRAVEAVFWIDPHNDDGGGSVKTIAYFEGKVAMDVAPRGPSDRPARLRDDQWLTRYYSPYPPRWDVPQVEEAFRDRPAIFHRALQARASEGERIPLQFAVPSPQGDMSSPLGSRKITFLPRTSVESRIFAETNPTTGETIVIADRGLTIIIEGLDTDVPGLGRVDMIEINTDRLVAWYGSSAGGNLVLGTPMLGNAPLELYLEGNVVFRQGTRIIHAEQMYYDVPRRSGVVLNSELLTPVPEYEGLVRLKADILQQLDANRFVARNAMVTTSRLGLPEYWFRANSIDFLDEGSPQGPPVVLPSVFPASPPPTQRRATSRGNTLYIKGVPVLYWPVLATNLEHPTFYLEKLSIKNDRIFGTQVLTDWNAYELLGIRNPPMGTQWRLTLDYLSDRGPATGTSFEYQREGVLGIPGPAAGFLDAWGISDSGLDTLGGARSNLTPEADPRGRVLARHRHILPYDMEFTSELGFISDRHFLEQYFENEWDEFKDQTTGLELKQFLENASWSITSNGRLNEFFTQTEWLPRLDHFWLGESLVGDRLTWFEHSHAGFARLRVTDTPKNAVIADKFTLLPWEVNATGERLATRQELDLPLQLGPMKIVPFALGELAHWGEDITGQEIQRAYGRAGIRLSLPLWSVNPTVESGLWNLHGLAHKVVLDAEASYADSNRDMTQLPLYDPLDDDSIEQFRRRYPFDVFGGPAIPMRFDPRLYALRDGLADWVTSPVPEIAEDLVAVRFGARQRWQTKRGPLGNRRIVDWVVLDTRAVYFPDSARDNFGASLGLAGYDFRWHVGDRTTIVSDGMFDFFDQGQQIMTVGGFVNRPPRSSLYVGFRSLKGPIDAQVVAVSTSYVMSPKWVSTFGASVDLSDTGNVGERFTITRIGESFLASAGFTVDNNKDNVGVIFAIEPRFLPFSSLARSVGARIPAWGEYGFE